jgi:nucleoside-diphosphate-sugar epimerase
MSILVTGGGGFIGLGLAEAIAGRGETAVAFDVAFPAAVEASARLKLVRGDVTDAAGVIAAARLHGVDRIIHAAAIVGIAPAVQMATTVVRVNVEGSINVFEAARILGVRRVVHMSSEEVYGAYASDCVDESSPALPPTVYGASKLATEHFGRAWGAMHGLEVINLRIGWAYGLRLPRERVPKILVDAAVRGEPLHLAEGGASRMDHTYVDDIVHGTLAALDHPVHPFDTYNLATGVARSVSEMIAILRDIVPGARISAGGGAIKHPGGIDMPRKGALDIARAQNTFGYSPRYDLRAGLEAYVRDRRRGLDRAIRDR